MPIEVTARHMHVNDAIQSYARQRAEELVGEFDRLEHVHVILDVQKRGNIAEVVVQGKNHTRVEASETAETIRAAIDSAFAKTERQLRKVTEKVQDHREAMLTTERERRRGAQE